MSTLPPLGALLLPLVALLTQPILATNPYTSSMSETPKDNNADCDCYVVQSGSNSQTPEYFQYYRFYDFRNLPGAFDSPPPLLNDSEIAATAPPWQPDLFDSDAWNYDWGIQNWNKPSTEDFPTPMNNSLANVWLGSEGDTSYLGLRTSRLDDYQTAAEIENEQKNLMHASLRMYGRVDGAKGAVAGFFTFYDDDNESDIEILTTDPTDKIRYTNQPSVGKDGNEVASASVGPDNLPSWNDWQTHRIDWLPKNSFWYLDQKQVAGNTYSVPRKPSFLVMNMWSDGGEWSGDMEVGDVAEFHVQWVEMAFNTSGPYDGGPDPEKRDTSSLFGRKRSEKGCKTVCKIDDVKQVGTPEVVHSGAMGMGVSWGLLTFVGLVSVVVAF
ncbi:glycoside hydrolase family 16 protein [Stemphylium lycopersici]|uniref:Glycoside hydrolase family 16 protein n=1 Tax=Stemphylium lycopersici TaxID=183478 RepID=A0A364MZX9_STELY|nr:glycoside hydrolase family 16 protein [Stemphylium lycopersici]RAR08060.1 glycoside hydrolase family 16 protein [Stemphylium lycopersici]